MPVTRLPNFQYAIIKTITKYNEEGMFPYDSHTANFFMSEERCQLTRRWKLFKHEMEGAR